MTANGLRRVRPGEPVNIPAAAWNRVVDEVRIHPQFIGTNEAAPRPNFTLRLKNFTTGTLPRWGVLQVDDMLERPTGPTGDATDTFEQWPGVVGVVPGLSSAATKAYVVAVEPIPAGEIGNGAIAGVVQSRVQIRCTGHQYARPKSSEVGYLESADAGPFRILWRGTGATGMTGVWSLVMFGTETDPSTLSGHVTGATQLLGHGKATTGASGCDGGLQWYSVTECSGTPSYSSSYFL